MKPERKISVIHADPGQPVTADEFNAWMAVYQLKPRDVARYLKANSATVSRYRKDGAPHMVRLAMRSYGAETQEWENI